MKATCILDPIEPQLATCIQDPIEAVQKGDIFFKDDKLVYFDISTKLVVKYFNFRGDTFWGSSIHKKCLRPIEEINNSFFHFYAGNNIILVIRNFTLFTEWLSSCVINFILIFYSFPILLLYF